MQGTGELLKEFANARVRPCKGARDIVENVWRTLADIARRWTVPNRVRRIVVFPRYTPFVGTTPVYSAPADVRDFCQSQLDEQSRSFLRLATNQLSLSARAFHRILKVARTIADLSASENITTAHVAEAVQYRQRSRAV